MPGHRNKRLGIAKPGNGSWENFRPGNKAAVVHGASSADIYRPVAAEITQRMVSAPGCE